MRLLAERNAQLAIFFVTFCVIGLYFTTLLVTTGGHPISPLDDAYIHFQYAKQIALGDPWRYNSGDPISTGATSFLYPFLLAAGFLAGFQSQQIVWVALLIGSVSLLASAQLIYLITLDLLKSMSPQDMRLLKMTSLFSALLFVLNGAIQWAYLNGMESGIFTLFVLASLSAAIKRRFWLVALFLILASFLRPEGLLLCGAAWIVIVGQQLLFKPRQLGDVLWPMSIALLLSAVPSLANIALTGTPVATGAQAKSWFGNVPPRSIDIIQSIARMARDMTLRMSMGSLAPKPWPVVPLVLPSAVVGAIGIWRRGDRLAVLLISSWVFIGTVAVATLITALWQIGRYQVPFLAMTMPLAAAGIYVLLGWIKEGSVRHIAAAIIFFLLLFAGLLTTYEAQIEYHFALDSIQRQQIALGDWIRKNLPQDERVAVHDAGAIRYLGERPIHDLIGLTTQGAAEAWRHGSGAQFELMEDLENRPGYFATYPDIQAIPYFAETDLFAEELFVTEPYPRRTAGKAGPIQAVFRADWRLANSGSTVHQSNILQLTEGLPLVASIDVANLEDEQEKGLVWSEKTILPGFATEVRQYRYRADEQTEVIDGGRMITGKASFPVSAQPGLPLILAARLHAAAEGAVRVLVDGQDVGQWRYPAAPGQWIETIFVVPAHLVQRKNPQIELVLQEEEKLEQPFPLFYLWAWQGEPQGSSITFQKDETFEFDSGLRLINFDLDLSQVAAGQTIPLTLYWITDKPQAIDAKLFVHLYDEDGNLVAQIDQRPYFDILPPYSWIPGIPIVDPLRFPLPSDLTPGIYSLAVGLYDPITGERYAVSGSSERIFPDRRLFLGNIEVP